MISEDMLPTLSGLSLAFGSTHSDEKKTPKTCQKKTHPLRLRLKNSFARNAYVYGDVSRFLVHIHHFLHITTPVRGKFAISRVSTRKKDRDCSYLENVFFTCVSENTPPPTHTHIQKTLPYIYDPPQKNERQQKYVPRYSSLSKIIYLVSERIYVMISQWAYFGRKWAYSVSKNEYIQDFSMILFKRFKNEHCTPFGHFLHQNKHSITSLATSSFKSLEYIHLKLNTFIFVQKYVHREI